MRSGRVRELVLTAGPLELNPTLPVLPVLGRHPSERGLDLPGQAQGIRSQLISLEFRLGVGLGGWLV